MSRRRQTRDVHGKLGKFLVSEGAVCDLAVVPAQRGVVRSVVLQSCSLPAGRRMATCPAPTLRRCVSSQRLFSKKSVSEPRHTEGERWEEACQLLSDPSWTSRRHSRSPSSPVCISDGGGSAMRGLVGGGGAEEEEAEAEEEAGGGGASSSLGRFRESAAPPGGSRSRSECPA